jgi:glycosyltransferase involved in cell wall biosynthesis
MTSLTEGMPVSVLEAFACETKVVACNCSGIKDLLEPSIDKIKEPLLAKHGYILPIMNDWRPTAADTYDEKELQLIEGITKALNSKMENEVNLASEFSLSFGAKKIAEEYTNLFKQLNK